MSVREGSPLCESAGWGVLQRVSVRTKVLPQLHAAVTWKKGTIYMLIEQNNINILNLLILTFLFSLNCPQYSNIGHTFLALKLLTY